MKKYKVNVNNKSYVIEIEEIKENFTGGQSASNVPVPTTISTPAPTPVAVPSAPPVSEQKPKTVTTSGGGESIMSPMPGTVLKVNVKEGQQVKKGEVLLILEAMKMENEIMAPSDGTVTKVCVNSGATVETGDVLLVM